MLNFELKLEFLCTQNPTCRALQNLLPLENDEFRKNSRFLDRPFLGVVLQWTKSNLTVRQSYSNAYHIRVNNFESLAFERSVVSIAHSKKIVR